MFSIIHAFYKAAERGSYQGAQCLEGPAKNYVCVILNLIPCGLQQIQSKKPKLHSQISHPGSRMLT